MNLQSENIEKLVEALAKAQGEIEVAVYDSANPHYKSNYASYEAIRKVCKKPLADNGLAVMHLLTIQDGKRVMVTQLSHASGQWIRSYLHLPQEKETPQGIGSSVTYAKRYSLGALLALSSDKDNDGEDIETPYRDEDAKSKVDRELNEPLPRDKQEFFAAEIIRLNAKDAYADIFKDRKPTSWTKRDLKQLNAIIIEAKKLAGEA
jgi:hypothetical protein